MKSSKVKRLIKQGWANTLQTIPANCDELIKTIKLILLER